MRKCSRCREELPETEFHRKGTGKFDSACRKCRKVQDRERYDARLSPESKKAIQEKRRFRLLPEEEKLARKRLLAKAVWRRKKDWVVATKKKPCADCGGVFHTDAMEYDHRPGESKSFYLGGCGCMSKERILRELEKCDLICANCHRVRTARRRAGLPATLPEPEFSI